MKIRKLVENLGGRYHVQITPFDFTALEEEKLDVFGEPIVNVGGTFLGYVTRFGQVNTVVTPSGGGGLGATFEPIIDINGAIVEIKILTPGTGYTSTPTLTITGAGFNAEALAVIDAGKVIDIEIIASGTGYQKTPVNVSFTLPNRHRRLRSDFPVKQVFDLADDVNADAKAEHWAKTIQDRMIEARDSVLLRARPLEGETVITV